MLTLLKKNYRIIITLMLLAISILGMIIFKQLLERAEHEFGSLTHPQYLINETYFFVFKYLLILTITYVFGTWSFSRYKEFKQLKNEKAKAELQLLKNQINPHFFFNTLNNLYGLTVEKSDKAPEMILKLSEMMRYTIYEGKEDFVALNSEITYLTNYIELHKIRYQKKVNISFDLDAKHNHKIAPLLFIILLENAFKHGVEGLTEDAYISMKLKTTDDDIRFSVENNFDLTKNVTSGIGLNNLKQRLKLMYPNKHNYSAEKQSSTYKTTLEIQIK